MSNKYLVKFPSGKYLQSSLGPVHTARVFDTLVDAHSVIRRHPWMSRQGGSPHPMLELERDLGIRHLNPDWQEFWTPTQAERQLINFKFAGPGWYLTPSSALLVTGYPSIEELTDMYWFRVWGARGDEVVLSLLSAARAPVVSRT